MTSATLFPVQVQRKTRLANDIIGLTLTPLAGTELPSFEAGAHIDLQLPNGLIRQYSLANDPASRDHYELGILLDPNSRGGSVSAHQQISEGDKLLISAPRNLFPLHQTPHYRLFAGGIGITPILAMATTLHTQGASFELHYCARSRARAAFVERLQNAAFAAQVHLYFDDEPGARTLDTVQLLAEPDNSHLYICGPEGFIRHITQTAADLGWSEEQVHFEKFAATPVSSMSAERPFEIQIASSGQIINVAASESAAEALQRSGIAVSLSCEQGICGSCLMAVIDGEPEHRDHFQTLNEKAANTGFTPCCSRARSRRLVLDL
jgi:vanillate monooxygenase ferredoxin subunit